MTSELAQIEFYFPQEKVENKEVLADLIVSEIKHNGALAYCGYTDEERLRNAIVDRLGAIADTGYEPISDEQKGEMQKVIEETLEKCHKILPIPVKNYIFVFPWVPTEGYSMFGGVIGVAPYSCVLHLFLSPRSWSPKGLADTVAHELNHTIFSYHHYDKFYNYDLLDQLVMEGLAENFREQIIDPKPAPWSVALEEGEAFTLLDAIKDKLDSKDEKLAQDLFFGSTEYQRWSGYSMGYWLVKKFIRQNKGLSWDEIMHLPSQEFLT